MGKKQFQKNGIKLVQAIGPYVELYFDWEDLPVINLENEYYIVELVPESPILPKEYARPNSTGPLYFCLKTGVKYQLNLIRTPHLVYSVQSNLHDLPHIDLVIEHENLIKMTWGNIDYQELKKSNDSETIIICSSSGMEEKQSFYGEPNCEVMERPGEIWGLLEDGPELFRVTTNLSEAEVAVSLDFELIPEPRTLFLSTMIKPVPEWRLRSEVSNFFQMRKAWKESFKEQFPDAELDNLIGVFRFFEDFKQASEVRQWGYCTIIQSSVIERIQKEEWKLKKALPVKEYKLQLQITSAHRELYKRVIQEKTYQKALDSKLVGFSEAEIENAEKNLFDIHPHVSWDQSFLELVVWFKTKDQDWQEFQRVSAHSYRWDYLPQPQSKQCRVEWVISDLKNPKNQVVALKSGTVMKENWPSKVVLKPFSVNRLLVWWDLDQSGVEEFLKSHWKVGFSDVGFYLKVHEEYLGNRIHRADLDCILVDLFSSHRNCYLSVEGNRCFSAEIVARHHEKELALTPVSKPIITPRAPFKTFQGGSNYRFSTRKWFHSSQREVRHASGRDSNNKAKVLIHLHMHSPNLFRADPFRESYLRDVTWPIQTDSGSEVHNPPGEWIMRNCLDAWLPLLRVFRNLANEGVDYQVSLDITPPVAYTLNSPRFKDYMSRYIARTQAFVRGRIALMKSRLDLPAFIWAAERYLEDVNALERFYNIELGKDMIGAFRELELRGFLELTTCTVTHGMPAALETTSEALQAQIALAARSHHNLFGDRPHGIWLAENSYFPGVEQILTHESLNFFFVEAEAVLSASHQPLEEEYNPVIIPRSQVVAFGRSRLGRDQVWDAKIGYAGHPDFREYHHRHMGLPIKRITSKTTDIKEAYNPDHAEGVAKNLAHDFHHKLSEKAHELSHRHFPAFPLISCTYDAELFGHHWFEGPIFLEALLREFYYSGDGIGLTTPSGYLANQPTLPDVTPNPSTWGHEALHIKWTDPKVAWTQRELERADGLHRQYLGLALQGKLNDIHIRMVEQMGAELLRAQSSDLTFVLMSGDFEEDMEREILKYLDYFYRLKYLIDNKISDENFLDFRLYENDMFPEIPNFYNIRPGN